VEGEEEVVFREERKCELDVEQLFWASVRESVDERLRIPVGLTAQQQCI
jgi:hypothetical protein